MNSSSTETRPSGKGSTPHKHVGLTHLLFATQNSWEGLGAAWKHESAFRQEVIIAALMATLAVFMPVGLLAKALLLSSLLAVLTVELINSAIEWTVDYISLELHPLAKRIKDLASAAVFLALLHAGIVWSLVIGHHWSGLLAWVGLE